MQAKEGGLAETTVKTAVLDMVLSIILAPANAYLGLFAGMTVSASMPAAVVSKGVLRLFNHSNIIENNMIERATSEPLRPKYFDAQFVT